MTARRLPPPPARPDEATATDAPKHGRGNSAPPAGAWHTRGENASAPGVGVASNACPPQNGHRLVWAVERRVASENRGHRSPPRSPAAQTARTCTDGRDGDSSANPGLEASPGKIPSAAILKARHCRVRRTDGRRDRVLS
eukprot:ctg_341.g99